MDKGEASLSSSQRALLDRPGPGGLRLALTLALLAILGIQAARLVWVFLAPASPLPAAAKAGPAAAATDPAILERFDPFRDAPAAAANPAAQSASSQQPAFVLFGLRTGGRSAAAIIGVPGGPQKAYSIGDEVAPGVVLNAIDADHVVLSRGGVLTDLPLAREKVGLAPGGVLLSPHGQTRGGEGTS